MLKRLSPNTSATELTFTFEAVTLRAAAGSSIATALLQNGVDCFRHSVRSNSPRMPYCLMGACFECTVLADGVPVQACLTPIVAGMSIEREVS
jgi:aerobic-type carbon monoxide dehydrogenase small subunit (CoxS/CutS family)